MQGTRATRSRSPRRLRAQTCGRRLAPLEPLEWRMLLSLSVPAFSSQPGAAYTIYLDFGGFTFSGNWGNTGKAPGTTPAYDDDNNATSFNATELANIQDIWSRVAEEYVAFHINITTVDPAATAGQAATDAQRQSYYDGQTKMMHTVVGGTGAWYGSAGGVSFVGVTPTVQSGGLHTNWIFTAYSNEGIADDTQVIGQAAAHENGHGLGLSHQSDYNGNTLVSEYSTGTAAVAPVMGVAYNSTRGLWSVGTAHVNNIAPTTQNDVKIIVGDSGMGGYVSDGIGHTMSSATALTLIGGVVATGSSMGVIVPKLTSNPNPVGSSNYTTDFWSFSTVGGPVSLTVNSGRSTITPGVPDPGATLNATLNILNSSGIVIASASTSSLSETLNLTLNPGTYYAQILAAGDASDSTHTLRTFYDIGDYFLSGSVATTPSSAIVGRRVFYKGSFYDTGGHDNAIAPDKTALLPGQAATFANYTSYSRGLNGIMIDIAGAFGTLSASDFAFNVGNDNNPGAWITAPAISSFTVRPGAGTNGSTRIEITWADNAIQNQWLQVTVLAGVDTALSANDVFYFGNAIAESGNSATDARVNAGDEIAARVNAANLTSQTSAQALANAFDYNRDGHVDATDEGIAGSHYTNFLNAVNLINLTLPPSAPAASPQATSSPAPSDPAPSDTPPAALVPDDIEVVPAPDDAIYPPPLVTGVQPNGKTTAVTRHARAISRPAKMQRPQRVGKSWAHLRAKVLQLLGRGF